jgi:hypothetical protein
VVKREARAEAVVIKEAAPTLTVCIVVAISTPRVREEWVEHGIVYLAKDGLEEPERIGEGGMVGPAKVEGLLREGYVALPAGIAGAATMPRPSRPWRWRWPDSSNVVCLVDKVGSKGLLTKEPRDKLRHTWRLFGSISTSYALLT